MFLIIDNTQRKIRQQIKDSMMLSHIPCVVCNLDEADLYMPAALIIVTEQYLYNDAVYISSLNGKTPVVIWSGEDMIQFALAKYTEYYNTEFANSRIHHLITKGNEVLYCGKPLKLTRSERRILNLLQYAPRWYDKETIAAYCLKGGRRDSDAVAVHICNINAKTQRIIGLNVITCKRYSGYKLKDEY